MKLFIFAGEPSGDLHGEKLLKALPGVNAVGVGGPKMRAAGLNCICPMENFQVMGFVDVILRLPQILFHFYKIRSFILKENPEVCVFIDYPGFNLRMERSLRKKGYKGKLVHYICPSVWAHGKGRIQVMEENLDLLLSILPFEKELFDPSKLKVEYVGHPLVQRIKEYPYKPFSLPKNTVALFPGSRKKEIERNLPLYLKVLKQFPELPIAISVSNPRYLPLMPKNAILVPADYTYELMNEATFAIAKSGTVTLELGLHKTPTIVTYAISYIDTLAAKYIFRLNLKYYCLVNILLNKEVFPELMGPAFTEQALTSAIKTLNHQKCIEECKTLISLLGPKDASSTAAVFILNLQGDRQNR